MWGSKLTIHVLLQGGSGATWGRRRRTKANGPAKSGERTGVGDGTPMSGSNSVTENSVSKSGWTVLSETEDGRRRKTLEEALASERGQFQRLWESVCGHVSGGWSRRLKACYLSKDKLGKGRLSLGGKEK